MLALTADKIDKNDRHRPSLAARALGSPLVDLLLGPHGVDRYLELVRPSSTVKEARAEVTAVRRKGTREINPAPDTRLQAEDIVVLLGTPSDIARAEIRLLQG